MSTMIPAQVLTRWEANTAAREKTQIYDLIELRGYIQDAKAEGERVVMEMYQEAASRFRMSTKSLQNKVLVLREYPDDKLIAWIEAGYAFEAIKRVGELASLDMTKGESPADILDRCVNNNGDGKTPSADELESLVLEQHGYKPADYFVNRFAYRLCKAAGVRDSDGFLRELRGLVEKFR